jgi:hypothetical protein
MIRLGMFHSFADPGGVSPVGQPERSEGIFSIPPCQIPDGRKEKLLPSGGGVVVPRPSARVAKQLSLRGAGFHCRQVTTAASLFLLMPATRQSLSSSRICRQFPSLGGVYGEVGRGGRSVPSSHYGNQLSNDAGEARRGDRRANNPNVSCPGRERFARKVSGSVGEGIIPAGRGFIPGPEYRLTIRSLAAACCPTGWIIHCRKKNSAKCAA